MRNKRQIVYIILLVTMVLHAVAKTVADNIDLSERRSYGDDFDFDGFGDTS